jgi:hypothetical protein
LGGPPIATSHAARLPLYSDQLPAHNFHSCKYTFSVNWRASHGKSTSPRPEILFCHFARYSQINRVFAPLLILKAPECLSTAAQTGAPPRCSCLELYKASFISVPALVGMSLRARSLLAPIGLISPGPLAIMVSKTPAPSIHRRCISRKTVPPPKA